MNSSSKRNIVGVPPNGKKLEKDEDLLLFRELHKREKDRIASLLQPVSDEFEPNGGNYALYRIASGKKGSGYDQFFPENNNKNDYDWLKTPPATPLFPSLEMEANNAPEIVIQRELPILQPLSRFAGTNESNKARSTSSSSSSSSGRPKSPNPKPKITAKRSITPMSHRPISSLSSTTSDQPKNTKVLVNHKIIIGSTTTNIDPPPNNKLRTNLSTQKPNSNHIDNFLTSNLSKNLETTSTNNNKANIKQQPRSRGVSPLARSTIRTVAPPPDPVQQFQGFSDETPPNLKTDLRATSATRGRPQLQPKAQTTNQTNSKPIRQSCSPCTTRGRRVAEPISKQDHIIVKGTPQLFLGSKIVEKVMNARKLSSVEQVIRDHTKPKSRAAASSTNQTGGNLVRTKHAYGHKT